MTILPCLRRGHTVNASSTVVSVVQLGWVSAIAWCVLACESKSNFEGGPKDSMGAGGEDLGVSTRQGERGRRDDQQRHYQQRHYQQRHYQYWRDQPTPVQFGGGLPGGFSAL